MAQSQKINTDKYGVLNVVQSYQESPRIIHRLENGAYVFGSGLPVTDRNDLKKGLPAQALQTALDWFDHKKDKEDNPAREIMVLPNNRVVFADTGEDVQNIQDIVAYWEPGPFREAAMIAFADKLKADKDAKNVMAAAPKAPPKKKSKKKGPAPAKAAAAPKQAESAAMTT